MPKLKWEGYGDRHAYLANGLHLRVTRIDPPKGEPWWMWTVDDPMIRTSVASSHTTQYPIEDLDRAERDCIEAARSIKPWGGG